MMVGENKILTVSYGTFSCTLEGFDDPFSAMREIAEYFRDLAANDRYFGAEPPTPDPDRLHMIAQARTTRTVEADVGDDGSIALRQAEPSPDQPTPAEPAVTDADPIAPSETPDTPPTGPRDVDEAPVQDVAQHPVSLDDASPLVARLARLQAATDPGYENEPDYPSADQATDDTDELSRDSVVTSLRAAFRENIETPPPDDTADEAQVQSPDPTNDVAVPKPQLVSDDQPTPLPAEAAMDDDYEDEGDNAGTGGDIPAGGVGAAILTRAPIDTGGGTADRIFKEADTQLDDAEARRRHSAIAHLKAAVSATVADRNILGWRTKQNAKEADAYREDLAKAVRPTTDNARTDKSVDRVETTDTADETEQPDPLILASEKRVEPLELAPSDRITPRKTESFTEFAKRAGAYSLADLLEAAAAYSGQIEGRPQFSRTQIMRHVSVAATDTYSREDGLRSFGILLRQGKIQKLEKGLFSLSDGSRFMPGNRLAGE